MGEIDSEESEDEFLCFRPGRQNPARVLEDTELSFRWTAAELQEELGPPENWTDPGLKVKVYIDDMNNVEKVCHTNAISSTTCAKRRVLAHAQHSEENFKAVKKRAEEIGMSLNDEKTQLLCVTGNTDSTISTYIRTDQTKEIASSESLKLLGFWFGKRPTAEVHVEKISAKFRKRLWALRHLSASGMSSEDLKKIYLSTIRPVLNFVAPTYHPLLNMQQCNQLEALQKRAAKIIYGFSRSYSEIISSGDLETLESRRETLCLSFAKKTSSNPLFKDWFPERAHSGHDTRHPEKYLVIKSRTERMKRNPVNYMRTILNKL